MAMILWHCCAPWSASLRVRNPDGDLDAEARDMGHEVVMSAFWGLAGAATVWEGITVLPGFGGQYCSPSLQQHARHVNPDLVITLGDVWVLDPAVTAGASGGALAAGGLPADVDGGPECGGGGRARS